MHRPKLIRAWGLICLLAVPLAGQAQDVSQTLELDDILTASELQAYQLKPDYRNRMGLFRRVLERLGEQISRHTQEKNYDAIGRTLLDLRSVAVHGIEQSRQSHTLKDGRSRTVKSLEIELRRVIARLEDLKQTVHFELRLIFEEVQKDLEGYRSEVLSLVFKSPEGVLSTGAALPGRLSLGFGAVSSFVSTPVQRRRGSGITGDQFTEAEFEKIRDAQKLMARVKTFIEISEARLREIARRREGLEWKGDDENPLEFFTVAQMVHAYDRSIEGIMVFIDEKATRKLEEEKEIKKALTLLNKKIQEFIPQLEPIYKQAFDDQDEELFIEIRSAIKNSDKALKGSQLGLGAPANN